MTGSNLDWPPAFERTPAGERSRNNSFDVSLSKAFTDLETELGRLNVEDYRYSFDAQQRQTDQRPYARASPDDPSFVLRWRMDGEQFAVACDTYSRLRDNVRTVGHYIREKRKMESRPVATGESEFANARLPPAEGGPVVASEPPHEVLGVARGADAATVNQAFRALVKSAHPDNGGSSHAVKQLTEAREAMLDE